LKYYKLVYLNLTKKESFKYDSTVYLLKKMVEGTRIAVYGFLEDFLRKEERAISEEAEQIIRETKGYEEDLKELVQNIENVTESVHKLNGVWKKLEQKRVSGLWGTTRCTIPLRRVEM